ncbi:uncharacterized protein LOC106764274 isoform X2 [Vigna radiata var. radiata]|nr:uncharacterized protein LOC106764274 isoform X2 [Vigna radiata var. radiata]
MDWDPQNLYTMDLVPWKLVPFLLEPVTRLRIKNPKRQGKTISKGHKNYELMLNLQLVRGNDALRELSSLGKNGSLFYLTNDMIKTMRKAEVKGEAKSAQLIGQAIANNPTFIILRKIEAAIEIVHTISNATNKVSLNSVVVEY